MMDLDGVRAFVTFAEHLNLTRAAKALHVSQPALHARIKKLSEGVGRPLYRREGRRLVLTPAGEEVARFGRTVVRQAAELEARLKGRAERQPVVLVAGEGAWLYLLGPAVKAFLERDEAPLTLWTRGGVEAVEAVRWGKAHLGVTSVPEGRGGEPDLVPLGDGLEVRELVRVPQVLLMPKEHPLATGSVMSPDALAGARLIVPPHGRPLREALEVALAGVPWEVAVEASGWPLMLRFVEMGVGLAVVNGCCPPPPGCVARPLPALPKRVYVAMRRAELRDDAVERLMGWMVERVPEVAQGAA